MLLCRLSCGAMAAVCIVSWMYGCGLTPLSWQLMLANLLFAAGRCAKTFGLASHCRMLLPNVTPVAMDILLLEEATLPYSTPVARNSFVTGKHARCWLPPCQTGVMATDRQHVCGSDSSVAMRHRLKVLLFIYHQLRCIRKWRLFKCC